MAGWDAGTGAGTCGMGGLLYAGTGTRGGADTGAGAGKLGLLCAAVVFWRAMSASLSRMLGMADGCGAGLLPTPRDERRLGGGLPGGVVDTSIEGDG